jgi:hypothetical protein
MLAGCWKTRQVPPSASIILHPRERKIRAIYVEYSAIGIVYREFWSTPSAGHGSHVYTSADVLPVAGYCVYGLLLQDYYYLVYIKLYYYY